MTSGPLVAYVVVKPAPEPVAGVPPGAAQPKVIVPVPPDAEAVQLTGLPAVSPVVGQVTVTVITTGLTVTPLVTLAETVLVSVAVSFTWKVVVVVTVYVYVTEVPDPAGEPSPKSQANV